MTDLPAWVIGATLGITGWIIGTRLARRIADWWNEIAHWADEPDPSTCDSDAVTTYLTRTTHQPKEPT